MGFYSKYGLDVDVIKTAGWAVARDKSCPVNTTPPACSTDAPGDVHGGRLDRHAFRMPLVENINGQAIVLHVKHKDKRDPKQWKGFKFGVPFDYSMHNFPALLRGRAWPGPGQGHPDSRRAAAGDGRQPACRKPRWLPLPDRSTNVRYGKSRLLHTLTKDIWEGICCAFACSEKFTTDCPTPMAP